MNRRRFLSMLGLAAAGLAVPAALPEFLHPETDAEYYQRFRKKFEVGHPGWVSYRVHYTVTLPKNRVGKLRYIDSVGAIC